MQQERLTTNFPDGIYTPHTIATKLAQTLPGPEQQKLLMMLAGWEVASLIQNHQTITVGSGRTSEAATLAIGWRIEQQQLTDISGIATSRKLANLANAQNISVDDFDKTLQAIREKKPLGKFDIGFDGADEIEVILDENGVVVGFRIIKGGGGAHVIEKIEDQCCDELIIIADESKLVPELGDYTVALEVALNRDNEVIKELLERYPDLLSLDYKPAVDGNGLFESDFGRHVLRAKFGAGNIPDTMEDDLNTIPGVVDNGLFLKVQPKLVLIAGSDGKIHRLQVGDKVDKTHPLAKRIFKQNYSKPL